MNCLIIEDEPLAVKHLENQLAETGHELFVQAKLDSIDVAVSWLQQNRTDLIFMDIQLDDRLSFEIFDHVNIKTPVIFTTAFDQYITKAFDVNSISYLLKPVTVESLKSALDKYSSLYDRGINNPINDSIAHLNKNFQQRFLVRDGSFTRPIEEKEVAYFYIQNKHFLFLVTKDKKQFLYDTTLEILEQRLDPQKFFRINRQNIIGFDIVGKVSIYDNHRLLVQTDPPFKDELIVSRHRCANFRAWLNQ